MSLSVQRSHPPISTICTKQGTNKRYVIDCASLKILLVDTTHTQGKRAYHRNSEYFWVTYFCTFNFHCNLFFAVSTDCKNLLKLSSQLVNFCNFNSFNSKLLTTVNLFNNCEHFQNYSRSLVALMSWFCFLRTHCNGKGYSSPIVICFVLNYLHTSYIVITQSSSLTNDELAEIHSTDFMTCNKSEWTSWCAMNS